MTVELLIGAEIDVAEAVADATTEEVMTEDVVKLEASDWEDDENMLVSIPLAMAEAMEAAAESVGLRD